MTRTLAAVDLGAQSGRVAVGRFDGARLAVEEVHRFENVPVERDGRLRWDFERLWEDVVAGLRKAASAGEVASVAVDSWAVDFGLLDGGDRLLADPVHYRDRRRAAAFEGVLDRVPARELYERTAIQLLPINTIFELAALAADGDGALGSAARLLLVPDLFHRRLCGSDVTELTNASTTQCFDPHTGGWATDLLERLDVPTALLPDVVAPGTVLGEADAQAGLAGAAVVATATHDTAAAVAAVPLHGARSAYLSVGTWSLVGVESDAPVVSEEAFRANLTNESGVDGTYRVLRNVTGLWLLHECRRTWAAQGMEISFDELVELARAAPPLRSFVDPNAEVFLEPGDMPSRIRAFCRETNQPEPTDAGATARCVLESLALKHAGTVDALRQAAGVDPAELHVVGGGARNELLCKWTADAAGLPVLAGPEEATLLGNLLVQAMALGELSTLDEARDVVRASFAPSTYEPDDDAVWQEARERFARLGADVEVAV